MCACACARVRVLLSVGVPARINTVCQNFTVRSLHTSITNNPFSHGKCVRVSVCVSVKKKGSERKKECFSVTV